MTLNTKPIKEGKYTVEFAKLTGTTIRRLHKKHLTHIMAYKEANSPGLELRHYPSGRLVWTHYYRFGGKNFRHKLGIYPGVDIAEARNRHRASQSSIHRGTNPALEEKRKKREAGKEDLRTVKEAWAFYLENGLPHYRPSVQRVRKSNIERHLLPEFKNREIVDIGRDDIRDWLLALTRKRSKRGTPLSSSTIAAIRNDASSFFNYCEIKIKSVKTSPMAGLRFTFDEQDLFRKHEDLIYHNDEELTAIWRAIEKMAAGDWSPFVESIVKFSMLTGLRNANVLGLQKEWIKPYDCGIRIEYPKSAMKMKRDWWLPLSPQAVDVLNRVQSKGPLVFPGRTGKPFDFGTNARTTVRMLSGVGNFSLKRFRKTITTRLNELRDADGNLLPRLWIEEAMARETRRGSEKNYNASQYLDQKRIAMETWGRHVASLVGWELDSDNVIEIARGLR
jgi:integrase